MAWLRVQLTEQEQRIVSEERLSHPNERIRERMLVLWLLHNGVTRQKAAEIVGLGRATVVQRFVAAFRDGGLDGLRRWDPNRPGSRSQPGGCQFRMRLLSSSHVTDAPVPGTVMEGGFA